MKIQYINLQENKPIIYKENNNKTGIYKWENLINGKSYVGSAINLKRRLSFYFSSTSMRKKIQKGNSLIYSALLKHGYSNFNLEILEYCDKDVLIEREQYYIDLLNPKYNILRIAGSRFNIKHSEETKKLIELKSKGRKHTEKIKLKI